MKTPKVTVLMPVYNGEEFLKAAIGSILNQDFTDFEFLIINDGSTDSSGLIISSFTDKRIRSVVNEINIGLVNTLNKGLEIASGEYIARMDCDDISVKSRLSVQVKLMEENKAIGASGSCYSLLRHNKKSFADLPITNEEIKCFMIFNCPIAHPSAIIRSSLIKKHNLRYFSEYTHSEDFNLWSQISEFAELANTSDVLLHYRVHENQITGNLNFLSVKTKSLNAIRIRHLKILGVVPDKEELAIHNVISNGEKPDNPEQVISAERWLKKIVEVSRKNKNLEESYFEKIVLERWLRFCFNSFGAKKGIGYFYKSGVYSAIKLPLGRKIELVKQIYYAYKRMN